MVCRSHRISTTQVYLVLCRSRKYERITKLIALSELGHRSSNLLLALRSVLRLDSDSALFEFDWHSVLCNNL